ncbi:phosphoglucomutase [Flavobacterium psychrophilum]|jgi:phosphomannomutase|uniref:Phosphoglucomutase/phosphomannomutase family protein n=1 Tax=Flavobacterium psychrophilum (strain ATCC 49511 / DSM 21280 / CIP 103535 / JIP02/86) TaxID=402612 RepID=A6GYQ2_FLAPJ|nr:phospho-sugar mutase [Flavobacterium psychrophilum]AIG29937.1 phosphoglucomutase [Flavobacterium psychrophilum]AIG32214.1 phosphoglucomutase [Flavobacterium psychrophilum]AIG34370.1 phosphoglucomutase [Flavobacterium psychrophilum]AIG36733.1 phosphoglucomutase [Flavobacterium psychrophilum]AIG38997.1 phosphoglucomutase [Flavobacterium psychrophilum]
MNIPQNILDAVNVWLTPTFDSKTQDEIKEIMTSSPKELEDCFYKNLEFGTGGMRGIMGVGSNRINKYTLGKNTQGLSDYLHKSFPNQEIKVAIAYDCRHNSDSLAKVVADVFSANGIKVFLFSDMRPTPELSFAVKYLGCQAGIVLTASHNPPEYNGYKVYWEDGGQLVPPQDKEIIQVIDALNYDQIKFDANENLIEYIDVKVDDAFINSTIENASFKTLATAKEKLKIVFTSLHGTSIKLIPDVLEKAGYKNVEIVAEQAIPDGNFPTVKSPNPEEPEALTMAMALADKTNADIVIGTDPDSDRVGVAVRNTQGKMVLLNGNQSMVVMTNFLLEQWKKQGKITGNEFIGSTIVSTPMMLELASAYGIECKVGLTGFKWIAKFIKDFPNQKFIGGGEESFGFMVGDAVRDKDAVAATLLVCEMAAQAKENGSSLYEELLKLYVDFGFYKEHLISITKKGIEGANEIKQMMVNLRENPLKEINGERVVFIEDYQNLTAKNIFTNEIEALHLPKSNVLIYYLEDGSKICARPSGTEPKIKFYFSVNCTVENISEVTEAENYLDNKIKNIIVSMNLN